MNPVHPVDAASVLLLRDSPGGPQVYMVRRHPRNRFLANALVFVGGKRDEADSAIALQRRCSGPGDETLMARLGLQDPDRARGLYIAAIRESFEEAGILLAHEPDDVERLRSSLASGQTSFAQMLHEANVSLALDQLRYWDRWLTPEFEQRRFDTFFFACRCPDGQQASPDPKETSFGAWFTPRQALLQNEDKSVTLFPPTLVLLERLVRFDCVTQILAAAPDAPMPPIMPRPLMQRSEHPTLLLPEDHRYDHPDSAAGPKHYVMLKDGRWLHIRQPGQVLR